MTLNERLGGKGYKPRKDYAGRTVSGDWENSDRGGGHKWQKRVGKPVKKKSPTYQAYVLNKEEAVNERTLSSYIPSDRQGEASAANREYVKAQLKKKEDESTKNRGDLSKRDAGKIARQRLHNKRIMSMGENKEEVGCETKKVENKGKKKIDPNKNPVVEARVDQGRSDYGKATIRNWRHSGPSTVEPAMFDPENKRGKTIDKRREEHKARRGKKGAKVPTYKKESFSDWRTDLGVEGYVRWRDDRLVKYGIGHDGSDRKGSTSRPTGKQPKGKTVLQKETEKKYGKGVSALDVVKKQIEAKHGKGAIYDGKKK